MELVVNITKKTTKYLAQFPSIKRILFPFYEKLGFKELVHKQTNVNFNAHGFETLKLITQGLNQQQVKYWVDCGTLLGLIREGGLLKHDMDIDLGILASDYSEKIDAIFLESGFNLWRTIHLKGSNLLVEKTFLYKKIRIDLFMYQLVENEMISYTADNHPYLVSKYHLAAEEYMAIPNAYTYQPTKPMMIAGSKFMVPENPEKLLEELYGDWRVPKKYFNYLFDAKTVRMNPALRAKVTCHSA